MKHIFLFTLLSITFFLHSAESKINVKQFERKESDTTQELKMIGTRKGEVFHALLELKEKDFSFTLSTPRDCSTLCFRIAVLEAVQKDNGMSILAYMYQHREDATLVSEFSEYKEEQGICIIS